MLVKEYRICMPLTVEEYRIGQLYMISKHSLEQSSAGEGVEVTVNRSCEDPKHGRGQYTEKRIYLSSKLPGWAQTFVPKIFYITERAWNYYPFTITEYTCSFLPKLQIRIETQFENNRGDNNQVFVESPSPPPDEVCALDIAFDELPERYYKESEDLRLFRSVKTGRGPLVEGWRSDTQPIMCSYKRNIQDVLLIGHRQAVAWIDEWSGMSLEDVREFERDLQEQTNSKLKQNTVMDSAGPRHSLLTRSLSMTDEASLRKLGVQPPHDPETQSTQPPLHKRLNSSPE
ncbi:cytoplasmic phosphatidylinositol transfer protein 1-like isoform X2 [Polyodon spathula]|uniref:cytoplasmic phosphatidylinositol transfer protein 1-like isoform X2 n=1 Tax=Polyodon spathula TaxID=7913 RepID=UPI001B7E3539|nr:cytoplasmic phosphatidylinositol transfer protein 1-like isoform X2 [Polyodon spathula]